MLSMFDSAQIYDPLLCWLSSSSDLISSQTNIVASIVQCTLDMRLGMNAYASAQ